VCLYFKVIIMTVVWDSTEVCVIGDLFLSLELGYSASHGAFPGLQLSLRGISTSWDKEGAAGFGRTWSS
jgi:hypothetical protein